MRESFDLDSVQRLRPFGALEPKRRFIVRFHQIAPVIRIAHCGRGLLRIPERIIFDHEVVLIEQGCGLFTAGNAALRYEPGTLLFLSPFVAHGFSAPEPGTASHIAVHFDFSAAVPGAIESGRETAPYAAFFPGGAAIRPTDHVPLGHGIVSALRDIVDLHACDDALSDADASARLTTVLIQLLRWGRAAGAAGSAVADASLQLNRERMREVTAFVGSHISSPMSLDTLARVAGLSKSRFAEVFRNLVGESPQRYVERRRIVEARRLLADSAIPIKQVAARVGFDDPLYFSRAFRRIDGLSPSQFRAAAVAGAALREPDPAI